MGKRNRRKEKAPNEDSSSGHGTLPKSGSNYDLAPTSSERFEVYYRSQSLVSDEEWPDFMKACQSTLPTTFRITSSRAASKAVNEHVEQVFVPHLSNVVFEGIVQAPPTVLQWYPGHLAWQLSTAKQVIRKSTEFAKFQQFLVHESDSGNISRQEAVSMIPPLLLEVESQHNVIDCCAAPGSKTTQLLEALHTTSSKLSNAGSLPAGLLIANDSDAKRCHMLVHQSLNRIGSPNTMITNLDASAIPSIRVSDSSSERARLLQFDRILCDVPCSGDGTTRKNPNIWKTWKTADGLGLHGLQLRILSRAIQMLKPGGRLVYSTCSYNPIENEAVVSATLSSYPSVSLVDVFDKLATLKRRQGLLSWKVYDKEMNELNICENIDTKSGIGKKAKRPAHTCWPSGMEREHHLERCLRIYPHLQDTGGFFVAVFRKTKTHLPNIQTDLELEKAEHYLDADSAIADMLQEGGLNVMVEAEEVANEPTASRSTKRSPSPSLAQREDEKKTKIEEERDVSLLPRILIPKATEGAGRPFNEEPYSFLSPDDEDVKMCIEFFQLDPSFPTSNLFVRNGDGKALRSIYLTTSNIRDIINRNDYARMRLVSCGVKIFARQDAGNTGIYRCRWRVLQDGLSIMNAYIGSRRRIKTTLKALRGMLADQYPPIESFEEYQFKEDIKALENGSCICEILAGEEAGGKLQTSIILPLWKAPISLCLMVEKLEKRALSLRIFNEDLSQNDKQMRGGKVSVQSATKL
ncbi:MAG: hypothetical protein CYPHOPRED_000654 [Cyphobasidiales sp. Tagirdzhanova-0007]|nr:MAG: hypothetical protein CYPHOPRED_000654 [Cyphobasidiales sp. Tagirdzhanova-0007]